MIANYETFKVELFHKVRLHLLQSGEKSSLSREFLGQCIEEIRVKYKVDRSNIEVLTREALIRYNRNLNRTIKTVEISIVGSGGESSCEIKRSALPRYNKYLNDQSHRIGNEATDLIESAVDKIFDKIYFPSRDAHSRIGLVLGHVQSGKTANYIGLAAKAIDVGYRIVIILTSNNSALREQTQRRLNRDLVGHTLLFPVDDVIKWSEIKADLDDYLCPIDNKHFGYEKMTPKSLTSRRDFNLEEVQDSLLDLANSNSALFFVVKKHATSRNGSGILNKLNKWLGQYTSDGKVPLSCLIIDDECDSSTPNAAPRGKRGEGVVSSVHKQVSTLFGLFKQCSYVGYTATPFANIFMDLNAKTSLYPRDFIISLPRPKDYFGDVEFFTGEYPDVYQQIALGDLDNFCDMGRPIPESAKNALKYFIAARLEVVSRVRNDEYTDLLKDPSTSMIIHVSRLVFDQKKVFNKVKEYLEKLEVVEVWIEYKRSINGCLDRTEFNQLYKENITSLQLLEIRGNGDQLDYGSFDYPFLVCVGGDIISRGLTIEGLTCSYYLRDSSNYDSLLQMGRWFGFRKGYSDLVRLFTTQDIYDKFNFLVDVNSQLRDVIEDYALDPSKTPKDVAPAVKAHESMMPTGRMGKALDVRWVDGRLFQTLYNSVEVNSRNLIEVREFVTTHLITATNNSYESSRIVEGVHVNTLISNYTFPEDLNRVILNNINIVRQRVEQLKDIDWNVAIHTLVGHPDYDIGDIKIARVSRTVHFEHTYFKVKVLTDPQQTHIETKNRPRLVFYFYKSDMEELREITMVGFSIRFPSNQDADAYYQQIFN